MVQTSCKDVNQQMLVKALAAFLKRKMSRLPVWVDYIKLGRHKEMAPYDPDWIYTRLGSVLRHLYLRSPAGVGDLRKIYGGRKRRGTRPSHFCRASGTVARTALQSLEKLGLVEKHPNGGRVLTKQGRRDMDQIASRVFRDMKTTDKFELIKFPVGN